MITVLQVSYPLRCGHAIPGISKLGYLCFRYSSPPDPYLLYPCLPYPSQPYLSLPYLSLPYLSLPYSVARSQ
ncbi:hypothetical protein SAMN05444123_102129 [Rhodopseudomonas pseudopalustris]|uniref:Uncharacterized protein n=1 Tax=Rhodopseudomonas pseudopalustris TaxID=1513892 RepID=A0A1H8NIX7_9BRAD|nr:hypothetical protein SAMN05444123_102129 [Rhodopseudomonas pseudopalustris]